ncbi:hypothetical protein BXZ70DRAFT_559721 [Cristinia sonorae]|uniref:Uncharacterized protein n=1 Tax=Cristinia sonorae TaxID=1940300 RepID=A0A8K0UFH1_9AGAR|nr:hypothetical protein BXZ70DRAFT_559721 [Cristinia sonorae]
MKHPFASVQYLRNSLSTGTLNWMPGKVEKESDRETEKGKVPPVPPLPHNLHRFNSLSVAVPTYSPASDDSHRETSTLLPQRRRPLPKLPIRIPSPQTDTTSASGSSSIFVNVSTVDADGKPLAVASPGHYVKHTSKVTLLLGGQEEEVADQPMYTCGSAIEGILAVPRPSGLQSIDIKVEGRVRLREMAGNGSFNATLLDDLVYSWDAQQFLPFPSKVSFRYVLPTHYLSTLNGQRERLPPSYSAHVQGIPGAQVSVAYCVTVYMKHTRDMSEWWRSGSRIKIPFHFKTLTRPERNGPFPPALMKSPTIPKTLFKSTLRSRRRSSPDLDIQLFLPSSRTCAIREPIDFFITIYGDDESLGPFISYQPVASSFHPISPVHITSLSGLHAQFKPKPPPPLPPIRVKIQRRTVVDIKLPGNEHSVNTTRVLALGMIHTCTRGAKSVTWSGTITLPPTVQCGGFAASGITVTDTMVLNISQPDAPHTKYMPFSEVIPMRFTTETQDCDAATPLPDSDYD